MILLAKYLAKVLKVLNSEISPNQIAAGFAFGALIGLVPVKGLLPVILLIISFLLNINLVMVGLATMLFKLLSFLLDSLFNSVGYGLLVQMPSLKSFWTTLYNAPLVPFTRFNNTIVLGSFVVGLVLQVPLFFIAKTIVVQYRTQLRQRILKLKLVQVFQTTALYRFYQAYQGIRGE